MIKKNPQDRYESINELILDINKKIKKNYNLFNREELEN